MDAQKIAEYWPVFLSIFFVVIWCIRLEAKVLQLEADKNNLFGKFDSIQEQLLLISNSLARLEGKFESNNNNHNRSE